MTHPLEQLAPKTLRNLYWAFFLATALVGAALSTIGARYANIEQDGKRYDVIAFEFAKTPEAVEAMKAVWGPEGIAAARLQTWLDFIFLGCYSTLIALGCLALISQVAPGRLRTTGVLLAWTQWLAAALDAIENIGLLRSLAAPATNPWPAISYYAAAPKFAIVGAGILFILLFLPLAWRNEK